jgi:biofilm protein TabA
MIVDRLDNAALYSGLDAGIKTALEWLQNTDLSNLDTIRYDIDGDNIYAMVQAYDSKPASEGKWEAHRKYRDVQYVAAGLESIGYAHLSTLKVSQEYNDTDDYLLAEGEGDHVTMPAGTFMILAPEDAHMPCIAVGAPAPVRKVVVKVRVP